ncbi:MAG: hypothetical protein KDE55_14645 [Novosphingobium sp.]|nr:hypothetical protein [Novosphingobium sp.]
MGLIKLAIAGAAGYAFYKYANKESGTSPAFAAGEAGSIRNAGRESMRDAPRRWSKTDEASDASFPASDPPATY